MMCVFAFTAFAQEPEQIELGPNGTLVVRTNKKPIEYFETQIKLWEKKVKQDKKDANAWLNYFAATKSAYQMEVTNLMENVKNGLGVDMSDSKYKYAQIAEEAYKHLPNSFEANYMMHFRNNFFMKANYDYLLKAQEIKPFDQRIIIPLFRYYELIQDLTNAKIIAHEIAKQKTLNEIDYATAYNILMELEENAVLITNGYNEYLACLVLQKLKSIKPNVLITTNYIINPGNNFASENSDKTLNRIGLKSVRYPEVEETNNKKFNWENSIKEYEEREKKNFELIFNSNNPIYILNNTIRQYQELFGDKLYIHGLTYRYSKQPVNYIYNIKENYEKNYSLDYIKHDISPAPSDNYEQSMYYMYYPSALKLYEFYKEKGPYEQQQEMKKFLQVLSEKSGKDFNKIMETIDKPIDYPFIAENIDVKKIDKSFVALNASEHMGKFEVTNKEYRMFLNNLKKQKNYDLYFKCMVDTNKWNTIFPMSFHDPMTNMYAWHPAYDNYPVVNISYEGAVAYCKWLTEQYNQQHPEGKYVSFRLPTEQEWRYAAGSKNAKALTPFPNDKIYNCDPTITGKKKSKNSTDTTMQCMYLGNIKTDKGYHADGGFHTLKVESYVPNQLGLHNMFGNVAEMTSTKGVIKGGSWDDVFEDCTFDKNATYGDVDPRVGFRIMMEVVPEIEHWYSVKIDKNVYCLKYEEKISNYSTYIEDIEKLYGINSQEYKNALSDTMHWNPEKRQILHDYLNITSKIKTLYDSLGLVNLKNSLNKTYSTLLDTLTKEQLDNYLKFRSDQVFYSYLTENNYIKNSKDPNTIFTKEAYYAGKLDSICLKEKFMYYPVLRLPTENEKQLANTYTTKQLAKSEYAPTNLKSIHSIFVNKTYFDLVKHETKTFPGFYNIYELKPGLNLSDIKPFDLWENYRFVMTWKPWNPNQTK